MCLPEVVKTNVAVSAKTSLGCGLLLNSLLHFYLKRMAGGMTVGFSNSVFLSERDSADRNNAIAYFMREQNCFPR
jgi:glutaminase